MDHYLLTAVINNDLDNVQYFLEIGCPINKMCLGYSVQNNNFEITKLLLLYGADKSEVNIDKLAYEGKKDFVRLMMSKDLDELSSIEQSLSTPYTDYEEPTFSLNGVYQTIKQKILGLFINYEKI